MFATDKDREDVLSMVEQQGKGRAYEELGEVLREAVRDLRCEAERPGPEWTALAAVMSGIFCMGLTGIIAAGAVTEARRQRAEGHSSKHSTEPSG
jgi:hypothetical protein